MESSASGTGMDDCSKIDTLEEVLSCCEALRNQHGWSGARASCLEKLTSYIKSRNPDVGVVRWSESDYSYYMLECGVDVIGLLEPSPFHADSQDIQRLVEETVHEINHSFISDPRLCDTLAQLARDAGLDRKWVESVYGKLEDARLVEFAEGERPEDLPYLESVNRRAIAKGVAWYESRYRSSPWSDDPQSVEDQAYIALISEILLGEREKVAPATTEFLTPLEARIAEARLCDAADVPEIAIAIGRAFGAAFHA